MEIINTFLQKCLFAFCFFYVSLGYAIKKPDLTEYKTSKEKLQAWSDYCDEFIVVEDYNGLRNAAKQGLGMTPNEDVYNLSLFHFYIGVTFNYNTESDSAVVYLEKSEQYGRRAKHSRRITEALKELLFAYKNVGKIDKRQRVLEAMQIIIDTSKNEIAKALLQEGIADYYATNGQYEKALEYLLAGIKARSSKLKKGSNNTDSINYAVKLINVAELYTSFNQPKKSLEYLRESEGYLKDYVEGIAHRYKDYSSAFLILEQKDSADHYYNKLQKYLVDLKTDVGWANVASSDLEFAEYYLTHNDLANAKLSLVHATTLAPKYLDEFVIGELEYLKGKLAIALKNYPEAIAYLSKSEKIVKEGIPEVYNSHQKLFAEAYAATGNWHEAYNHLYIHARLNDSLQAEASKRNLADMEAKYQNEVKQEKILGLSTENGLQKFQLADAKRQRIYFTIGLMLLLGMIISMIIVYRNKLKSKKILEQKNAEMNLLNENLEKANITKAKLFSIISHDLRNPISQVYQFLDLQKTNPNLMSEVDRQAYSEQISRAAGVVLETMEDLLLWSKSQLQQFNVSAELINIKDAVQHVQDLLQSQLDHKQMRVNLNIPPKLILHTDKNILLVVLRNLIQNAITYSSNQSIIQIYARQENQHVVVQIIDDGAGMPERIRRIFNEPSMPIDSKNSGLGLTIVKEMIALIHAHIEISSNEPSGTCIDILFPNL